MLITRRFEFDAGHRVLGHESKCANLHGHRYVAEVSVSADKLDNLGRVIDFSEMKLAIGSWIDLMWDHTMILHPRDPLLLVAHEEALRHHPSIFGPKPPFIMPFNNPTAENMVVVLANTAQRLLPQLKVEHVRLYETPNCWADYSPERKPS